MRRKIISLFLISAFLLNTFVPVLAHEKLSHDSRLLDEVISEVKRCNTTRLLVMEAGTGEYGSIEVQSIRSASMSEGRIYLTYDRDGKLYEGFYMEPDLMKYAHATTVEPQSKEAAAEGSDIGLNRLFELVKDKTGAVVVAVLDTGIDTNHSWFKGRLFSPYDVVENDFVPQDLTGHGTHVAGIIASNTPSQIKIMPVRVFGNNGGASDFNIVKGIEYAVKNGADIINLSLGGYGTTSYLEKAIDYAYSKGVMVVTSAGNEARDLAHDYPAAFPEVITVGATGRDGDLLFYSNVGAELDVCAPGEKIISAAPGGGTHSRSGTSMAAPLVTSALAMLMLEDSSRTPGQLEALLKSNTRDLGPYGRDALFGVGELAFTNYRTNPDFYMITSPRDAIANEEKYSMNLSIYCGERTKQLLIRIDGSLLQSITVAKPGEMTVSLNIKTLKTGAHTLEIIPQDASGSPIQTYTESFSVPQYNLRISLFDILDRPVSGAEVTLLGFTKNTNTVEKIQTQFVIQNGTWMTNIDIQQLYARFSKIMAVTTAYPDGLGNYALYMRTTGVSGQKAYETSESNVLTISSNDPGIQNGCKVSTLMVGEDFIGFDTESLWRSNPNVYSIRAGSTTVQMIPENEAGRYSGLLYYDMSELYLEVTSSHSSTSTRYPQSWYYLGFIRDAGNKVDFNISENPRLILKTDSNVLYPIVFSLTDILTEKQIFGEFSENSSMLLPFGTYSLQAEPRRKLADGRIAWDFFRKSLDLAIAGDNVHSFGGSLKDTFRYDSKGNMILHEWLDAYDNSYNIRTEIKVGSGTYQAVLPKMTLKNTVTGNVTTISGTSISELNRGFEHGYRLSGVPDGDYEIGFTYDQSVMPYPVEPVKAIITIKKGAVYYPENTPPSSFSNYLSLVNPGSSFIYDLYEEFLDLDEDELIFTASKGWIVDGFFYYRDLVGKDQEIVITAYDTKGASASFTHNIRITDRMESEPEYTPIPEIDSMGATSWAVSYVMNAISAGIVPLKLLDAYQTTITREEFSELIVQAIEKVRGPIRIKPDVSFKDTSNVAVLKAASLNILSGYNGIFNPREELTRQQLCVMIYQAIGAVKPYKAYPVVNAPQFLDAAQVASWAKVAVDFCHSKEIIVGSGGIANPSGKLSREQAIIMVYKAFVYLK